MERERSWNALGEKLGVGAQRRLFARHPAKGEGWGRSQVLQTAVDAELHLRSYRALQAVTV